MSERFLIKRTVSFAILVFLLTSNNRVFPQTRQRAQSSSTNSKNATTSASRQKQFPIDKKNEPLAAALLSAGLWTDEELEKLLSIDPQKEYPSVKSDEKGNPIQDKNGKFVEEYVSGLRLRQVLARLKAYSAQDRLDEHTRKIYYGIVLGRGEDDVTQESTEEAKKQGKKFSEFTVTVKNHLKTDIEVKRGDKIEISASGKILLGPLAGYCDLNGIEYGTTYNIVRNARHGALLTRVTQHGDEAWDIAGAGTFVADNSGTLEFLVNDADYQNNQGQFNVTINIIRVK